LNPLSNKSKIKFLSLHIMVYDFMTVLKVTLKKLSDPSIISIRFKKLTAWTLSMIRNKLDLWKVASRLKADVL